jgi:glucose dehydrogenase
VGPGSAGAAEPRDAPARRARDPGGGPAELPAAGFATPATYRADGRQFVVVAAGGGKLGQPSGSRYVAFALPESR